MRDHGYIMDYHPLWSNIIMTACPEHIQIMLASDFPNYVKGDTYANPELMYPHRLLQALLSKMP